MWCEGTERGKLAQEWVHWCNIVNTAMFNESSEFGDQLNRDSNLGLL